MNQYSCAIGRNGGQWCSQAGLELGLDFQRFPTDAGPGAAGFNYLLQRSTNLVDWTPSALLLNTNGTVLFTDFSATNSAQRFYRALLP